MAGQQNGYRIVPHATYNQFRAYTLSTGVNVDYAYGNQCMDTIMLLYYQYGKRLRAGPYGYAYETWTNYRNQNTTPPFISFTGASNIKRGDILVFRAHGAYYTGHIAIADEDYRGGATIRILGQNQGQGIGTGCASNLINYNISYFLGGFRNRDWQSTPPGPTPPTPGPSSNFKQGFPWYIYNKKFRNNSR